eukprot:495219_1
MLRVIQQIRSKSLNGVHIHNIHQIHSHNAVHRHSLKLFSNSIPTRQLLDDSEDLDPELIAEDAFELPIDPINQSHIQTPHQISEEHVQHLNDHKSESENIQIPKPYPIQPQSKLPLSEIQDRQKKVWTSISNTLQGIWENMDSIDKTNVKRIDKVFKKLTKLESLHVKNIQHSLHHIAMLRDEVATVNSRINYVFERLSDLEKTAPSEWLEWSIPKYEIPFEDGVYLRSPGYEVGSMIWCIEVRWEMDETIQHKEHEADIEQYNDDTNPIIDIRDEENQHEEETQTGTGGDTDRMSKGYRRLGVYVSPRSVADWERLSSLKATCEVRVNENDYSDGMVMKSEHKEAMAPPDKSKKKQQHFSVSGEFLRGRKLTSWGRTIPNGDEFFDANKMEDELSIKLRIVNQTLSYHQFVDGKEEEESVAESISESDIQIETKKPEFSHFDFKDKKSDLMKQGKQTEIDEEVQAHMSVPIHEFWNVFSEQVESGKSKEGHSYIAIAKACDLDLNLVSMFRRGPMSFEVDDDDQDSKKKSDDGEILNLNAKQRERRKKKLLKRKLGHSKQWEMLVEYDLKNPEFRRKLATFLVNHQHKQRRNLQSKAHF